MKKKLVIIAITAGISAGIYIAGYFICKSYFMRGSPMHSYTADWTTRHYYLYIWIVSILLAVFNRPATSLATTAGCFIGIVIGDVLGEFIRTIRLSNLDRLIAEGASPGAIQQLYTHYGVLIWLGVIVVSYIIGLNIDKKLKKRRLI